MTPRTISVERESEIINAIEETKRTFGNKTLGGDLHAELMAERAAHQETQAKLDAAISRLEEDGHDEPCYYCGERTSDIAANPSMWSIPLCHPDDPGLVKWHHIGCVSDRCERFAEAQAISRELLESLTWAMNSGNLTYTQRIERQNGAYCDAVDLARARVAKARGVLPALPEKI